MTPLSRRSISTDTRLARQIRSDASDTRFQVLAAAVREHEERARRHLLGVRPYDDTLYRRLREIAGLA
jgi:hypothetical protein